MIRFESPLSLYTLGVEGEHQGKGFYVSYEVIAANEEDAARLVFADMVARGERPVDVDHAEVVSVATPMAAPGVRFRTGRTMY